MTHKKIKQRLEQMAEVWIKCNRQLLEECYSANFLGEYYGKKVDYQNLANRLTYLKDQQSERKMTFDDIVIENNRAAIRFLWQAVDKDAGEITLSIAAFYTFDENFQAEEGWAFANHKVDY